MKKAVMLGISLFVLVGFVSPSFAEQKKINMNAANIVKAMEAMKRNQELFKNKEALARYQRLAASLNKKK